LFTMIIRPPTSATLSPYTTLFRSKATDDRPETRGSAAAGNQEHRVLIFMGQTRGCPFPGKRTGLFWRDLYHSPYGYTGHKQQARSEEHTSELQSRENLVCRLLLEK